MPDIRIEVGAINISASPHPSNGYREILSAVSNKEVLVWGSDRAKITDLKPLEDRKGIFVGQILVWAEIDTDGKWLNKATNVAATEAEIQKVIEAIPPDIEPNFRAFNYAFIEDRHLLIFEFRNELGQHFGATRAEKMFTRLFTPKHLPKDAPSIEVTIIPEDDALEKILAIPKLRWLEILIKRPNPEDLTDEYGRILERLTKQGARSQKFELTKAPKVKKLTPDDETKKLAKIAETNGYVAAKGKDADGKPVYESTDKHPKVRTLEVGGASSFATFLSSLRFF